MRLCRDLGRVGHQRSPPSTPPNTSTEHRPPRPMPMQCVSAVFGRWSPEQRACLRPSPTPEAKRLHRRGDCLLADSAERRLGHRYCPPVVEGICHVGSLLWGTLVRFALQPCQRGLSGLVCVTCHIQHSPNAPTTGLRKHGNDTSKSTGRSDRKNAATRRNMRREERVTVQGPVTKQQADGMSHRGGGGRIVAAKGASSCITSVLLMCVTWTCNQMWTWI